MNIVLTGVSKGIGLEAAKFFIQQPNHKIFALSRNIKLIAEGIKTVQNPLSEIHIIQCDVSKEMEIKKTAEQIGSITSSVEILINNAGLLINKSLEEITLTDWKNVYDVNVFGVFALTKELLPLIKKGKLDEPANVSSHILNISSMGGIQGSMKFPGLSAYSSSKGALITMSECFAEELKDLGIRVNTIALGSVQTEMFTKAFPTLRASSSPPEVAEWISNFALTGYKFFNAKTIPLSSGTP